MLSSVELLLHLQPFTEETFPLASANVEDGACLDRLQQVVWGALRSEGFLRR